MRRITTSAARLRDRMGWCASGTGGRPKRRIPTRWPRWPAVALGAGVVLAGLDLAASGALAQDPDEALSDGRRPLVVTGVEGISFGRVVAAKNVPGSVIIDAETGAKRVTGGASDLRGRHSRAEFQVRGEPNARFVILLPDEFPLEGQGGRAVVTDLTSSPEGFGVLGPDGTATVYVGGTLDLNRAGSKGALAGRFDIIVEYE